MGCEGFVDHVGTVFVGGVIAAGVDGYGFGFFGIERRGCGESTQVLEDWVVGSRESAHADEGPSSGHTLQLVLALELWRENVGIKCDEQGTKVIVMRCGMMKIEGELCGFRQFSAKLESRANIKHLAQCPCSFTKDQGYPLTEDDIRIRARQTL